MDGINLIIQSKIMSNRLAHLYLLGVRGIVTQKTYNIYHYLDGDNLVVNNDWEVIGHQYLYPHR